MHPTRAQPCSPRPALGFFQGSTDLLLLRLPLFPHHLHPALPPREQLPASFPPPSSCPGQCLTGSSLALVPLLPQWTRLSEVMAVEERDSTACGQPSCPSPCEILELQKAIPVQVISVWGVDDFTVVPQKTEGPICPLSYGKQSSCLPRRKA